MKMKSKLQLLAAITMLAVFRVQAQEPSCANTRTAFLDIGGMPTGQIFSSLLPLAGSTCQLGTTCCSHEAETTFKKATVEDYTTKVVSKLRQSVGQCGNQSIFGAMSTFITANKNQLVGDIRRFYSRYSSRFETLFDRFFQYLSQSVHTGNSTELPEEFHQVFFEVFLASFLSHPNAPRNIPAGSPEFRSCFYNIYLEQNNHRVRDWLRGFVRSWNISMRYFRALRAMERVIDGIMSQQNFTEQCEASVMKMAACARCAGLASSVLSCQGMCLNTFRGCLVDLSDLVEPMQTFSHALVGMKDRVVRFNPFTQITLLQSYVFQLITTSSNNFLNTYTLVNSRCPIRSFLRRKREADGDGDVFGEVIRRSARAVIDVPLSTLNDSAHCLFSKMETLTRLPNTLCDGEDINTGNTNCWNGHQLGSYSRTVVDYNRRQQQSNNPEVLVCPGSRFADEIRILRYMTRELNSLTGVCSGDDEDCLMVTPTTLYYDLDGITDSREVTATPSFDDDTELSGSGNPVNACGPPTAPSTTDRLATTREVTMATPVTREVTTSTSREATTPALITRMTSQAVPSTTAASTTRLHTTVVPTTRPLTTNIPTNTPVVPDISTNPIVIVDGATQGTRIPSPPGGIETGVSIDGDHTENPGDAANLQQGSGSGDQELNGSQGLLPSLLALCMGVFLTLLLLATPSCNH